MKYLLAIPLALAAMPAMAEPGIDPARDTVFILNTFLFLVAGFLVFFMAAGFAMLEVGLVRTKNASTQALKNVMLFSIAAIMYWLVGYGLMYPGEAWTISGVLGAFSPASLEPVGASVDQINDISYASTGSDFFFQLMFCATTASIVSGTLAERIKLVPFLIFVIVLTAFIYPISASWKWGSGFLDSKFGFLDFAGSTLVHSAGGWAALAGAIVLGPRLGRYVSGKVVPFPGSNIPLAALGTFILWLGWFGFNGGSQLAMGSIGNVTDVSRIFVNTNIAACAGAVVAFIMTRVLYGKADVTMVLNGALVGLVSITAEPLTPSILMAIIIGGIGAVLAVLTVPLLDKFKIDDVVGAIPVHLVGGIWGTLAVLFTNPDATFVGQITGIFAIGVFVFAVSYLVWIVLNKTMGIRVSEQEEFDGLDQHEVGVQAYPEFKI